GSDERSEGKSFQARSDILSEQPWIRFVRTRDRRIEGISRNAGNDDDERKEQLQEGSKGKAALGLPDVLRGKGTLDDVLVATPVEQVSHPHPTEQDSQAGKQIERILSIPRIIQVDELAG